MAKVPDSLTVTGAARAKRCSRGSVHFAIASGIINTESTRDGLTLIVIDSAFAAWKPAATGKRGRPKSR